jgi:uncharacterized membrane protein (DUF4010 family)
MTEPLFIAERLALVVALAFFLGLAFEDVYKRDDRITPGGVRTFPILALAGAGLYMIEPVRMLPYVVGLAAIGAWLTLFLYRQATAGSGTLAFMVPICNLITYVLGPIALTQPAWLAVALTVSTVLFMSGREQLHRWAQIIPQDEIVTAGKFLILVGVILPLVPNTPLIAAAPLTPYHVWLAVVAVCAMSYVSYLVQRYLTRPGFALLSALMGGFYSSTATTVVLAKRLKEPNAGVAELGVGIVAATGVMYVRVGIIMLVFDRGLALALGPSLAGLFGASVALALWLHYRRREQPGAAHTPERLRMPARNPLQLTTAAVFALAFAVISLASTWVKISFGQLGLLAFAAVVGLADVDPLVVSLAQGGAPGLTADLVVSAVMIATATNNVLKAVYAVAFGGRARAAGPAIILVVLALGGYAIAAGYVLAPVLVATP